MPKKERWIAGLDLTPRSRGVVRFCRWLATRPEHPERSVAVHVVDSGLLGHIGLRSAKGSTLDRAAEAMRAFIAEHGDVSSFERITAVEGEWPSQTLEAARVFHHARGIVVGRNERSLGRVARRLLTGPTGVVAVVPATFQPPPGRPTVVCCCSLGTDEGQPVKVAQRIAADCGASLSLLHVLPALEPGGALYLPTRALGELDALRREDAQRDLARLAAQHRVDAECSVVTGSFVATVLAFTERKRAGLIVCGAPQRHGLDKVRTAGRSLELAQAASSPVLAVPTG